LPRHRSIVHEFPRSSRTSPDRAAPVAEVARRVRQRKLIEYLENDAVVIVIAALTPICLYGAMLTSM
jgi:hypothetical protein